MVSPYNPNLAPNLPPLGPRRVVYIEANRAPTATDTKYRAGTYYEPNTEWRDTSVTPPDIWKLAKINSKTSATWFKITGSPSGTVITLSDTSGTKVGPDATGNIQIEGTTGQIDVTSTPGSNKLTLSLPGGGGAVDSFTVQANTAPGTNPVIPTVLGDVTISGSVVAAHSVPIETRSRAANAFNIEAQLATVVNPTPANSNDAGIVSLNVNQFDIDATSGMVSLKGSTTLAPILTLTGDSGGAIGPTAGGNVSLLGAGANTGVVTTGSANQVDFNVYRWVAPSSNNWTPVLEGTTGAGVGTYIKQHGVYSRVGDMIFFTFDLEWSAHTGTGDMRITGFPKQFSYANTNYPWPVFFENIVLPAGTVQVEFVGENATTYGNIVGCIDSAVRSPVAMDASGVLAVYGFYFASQA